MAVLHNYMFFSYFSVKELLCLVNCLTWSPMDISDSVLSIHTSWCAPIMSIIGLQLQKYPTFLFSCNKYTMIENNINLHILLRWKCTLLKVKNLSEKSWNTRAWNNPIVYMKLDESIIWWNTRTELTCVRARDVSHDTCVTWPGHNGLVQCGVSGGYPWTMSPHIHGCVVVVALSLATNNIQQ